MSSSAEQLTQLERGRGKRGKCGDRSTLQIERCGNLRCGHETQACQTMPGPVEGVVDKRAQDDAEYSEVMPSRANPTQPLSAVPAPRPGSRPTARQPGAQPPVVPTPPGGHALQINRPEPRTVPVAVVLPVVNEVSAGGVMVRMVGGRPQVALIARRNRGGRLEWCLPKGHLEGAETPAEAAVREIAEETGIHGTVDCALGLIDYWFSGEDRRIHKVVHHFLLRATGGNLTVDNDPDGEAEDAAWVDVDDLDDRLSYPNERRLVGLARQVLAGRPMTPAVIGAQGVLTAPVPVVRPRPRSATDGS